MRVRRMREEVVNQVQRRVPPALGDTQNQFLAHAQVQAALVALQTHMRDAVAEPRHARLHVVRSAPQTPAATAATTSRSPV